MKIIDYKVVWYLDPDNLSISVSNLIKEGWQPIGDIIVMDYMGGMDKRFCQKMVKYEEESKVQSEASVNGEWIEI